MMSILLESAPKLVAGTLAGALSGSALGMSPRTGGLIGLISCIATKFLTPALQCLPTYEEDGFSVRVVGAFILEFTWFSTLTQVCQIAAQTLFNQSVPFGITSVVVNSSFLIGFVVLGDQIDVHETSSS